MSQPFPWNDYPDYRLEAFASGLIRHAEVWRTIDRLAMIRPGGMAVRKLGVSVEGRSISMITIGTGPRKVMMWSQMHGDEPTHTRVLLELLHLLQQSPEHQVACDILGSLTLILIPMLNPDGAEQATRRNAQDIDINRDARDLQSPEGRILRMAVDQVRPDFAFNLHNQNARTAVGPESRVAAVSLLVPPIDTLETETEKTLQAKRVASLFVRSVADHCPGMISRYDADFMPRSFGEAIQVSGVSTVLVEAGGWPAAGPVAREQAESGAEMLVRLHFVGLVSTLRALATGAESGADPSLYERLPRSNQHRRFDLMIERTMVSSGRGHEPFLADLGIDCGSGDSRPETIPVSRIVDLGDLAVTTGKHLIDGHGKICQPGRVIVDMATTPRKLPTLDECLEWLAQGVTSIVGVVDLASAKQVEQFVQLKSPLGLPVNIGFVGSCNNLKERHTDQQRDQLLRAISRGLFGVLSERLGSDASRYAEWFGLPRIERSQDLDPGILPTRGLIHCEAAADLVLVDETTGLRSTIVGGIVVFDCGRLTGNRPGVLLRKGPIVPGL
jgi:zinc carboxypeptidase